MKNALLFCFSLALFVNFAFAQVVREELKDLNRVMKITMDGKEYESGFMFINDSSAYYSIPDEYDVKLRASRGYKGPHYKVEFLIEDALISFKMKVGSKAKKFKATKTRVVIKRSQSNRVGLEYWSEFELTNEVSEVSIALGQTLTGSDSIGAPLTLSGPIEFSGCDGCEHGDQVMINNGKDTVNLADLNWGGYYVPDCPGTVHRLLEQLMYDQWEDTGLAVPFTFKGLINMNTGDLLETVGSYWLADKREGEVFIGHTTQVSVSRFLDSIIFKTAYTLNVEAHEIWDDVLENGNFTSYEGDELIFVYKGVTLKTDLKTLKTTVD